MFAGVPGKGAQQAWLTQALHAEFMRVSGRDYAEAAADIYKCFDQIVRQLLYLMMAITGVPLNLISTYARYHEGLGLRNTLVGGYGELYRRPRSLVQGCAISMTLVALVGRPWIFEMISRGVRPRLLADEFHITADGDVADRASRSVSSTTPWEIPSGASPSWAGSRRPGSPT